MRVSVILATYNEAENIKRLIPRIAEVLEGYDREIVIVDDNSPDGTAEIARRVSVPWRDRVKIIIRQHERGLTSAQLLGARNASGDVLVFMDADGQHDPRYIPKLLEWIPEYDLVIASRYVPGGSPEGLMGLKRYAYSIIANLLARVLFFPITWRIHDVMSGYFAVKKEYVCDRIDPRFPKLLLEILVMCRPRRVKEVPFKMSARLHGESKLGMKHVLEYIHQLLSLIKRTFFL